MITKRHSRRTRRHASERGAAMVEAIIVIPFFLIIFAALGFLQAVYHQKARVIESARRTAWQLAMSGCPNPVADPIDPAEPVEKQTLGTYSGAPGAELFKRKLGVTVGQANATVQATRLLGGYFVDAKASAYVMCNEMPIDGNLDGVIRTGWQSMTGW